MSQGSNTHGGQSKPTAVGFPVFALAFAPKKGRVFVGGGGGASRSGVKNTISMFSVEEDSLDLTYIAKHEFTTMEDSVQSICVNPKEKTIIVGANCSDDQVKAGNNQNCRIFTLKNDSLLLQTAFSTTSGIDDVFQRVARFSPNGELLLTGTSDGKLSVWKWPELELAMPELDAEGEIYDANFDSSSSTFVAVTSKKCIVVSVAKGKTVWSIDRPVVSQSKDDAEFRGARFGCGSSEGVLFLAVNAKSRKKAYVCRWTTDKWVMQRSKLVAVKPITAFTVSNDGALLGFGAADSSVNILSANTLVSKRKIRNAHNFPITALAFSPSGKTLVSGSADGTCNVVAVPEETSSTPLWVILLILILLILAGVFVIYVLEGGNDL
ncbi:quinon protein alcohol dehydrogenase-like superfamily [Chytriomyces cf. hyalinus JEL632]|nr:quinon protein alcohol dehydrogenase-like superfamily [Chytriomyces cf. hyalinus JEL632]